MIRRELPLTTHASPAKGLSQMSGGGFSFVLAPAAADRALELDSVIHGLNGFCFRKYALYATSRPSLRFDEFDNPQAAPAAWMLGRGNITRWEWLPKRNRPGFSVQIAGIALCMQ